MAKKKRVKKYAGAKTLKPNFNNFEDCVNWAKKCVYLIARGRKSLLEGREIITWVTIGTGFLVAPRRMATAGHVIIDKNKGGIFEHQDGDVYSFIKHDDEDNWHHVLWEPKLEKDIFVYPDIDLGIIHLEENFYKNEKFVFLDENTFLEIDSDFQKIGAEVGVLGYPLCPLTFDDKDMYKPRIGDILLRCDKGVINCRYKTSETNHLYEFTMNFNPGNSGGPIFNARSGKLVSMVHGYKSMLINIKESELNDQLRKSINIKKYTEDSYLEFMHAHYSVGFATPSFLEAFKKHDIV